MSDYEYSITTTSANLHVNFLNYLYAKKDVTVNIDTRNFNIYIKIKYENDFNEIMAKTKEFYGNNYAFTIPKPSITPVFVTAPEVTPTVEVITPTPEVTPTIEVTPTVEVIPTPPEVTPTPEVIPTPEVTPTSEVTPTPEVIPTPEETPTSEVTP